MYYFYNSKQKPFLFFKNNCRQPGFLQALVTHQQFLYLLRLTQASHKEGCFLLGTQKAVLAVRAAWMDSGEKLPVLQGRDLRERYATVVRLWSLLSLREKQGRCCGKVPPLDASSLSWPMWHQNCMVLGNTGNMVSRMAVSKGKGWGPEVEDMETAGRKP